MRLLSLLLLAACAPSVSTPEPGTPTSEPEVVEPEPEVLEDTDLDVEEPDELEPPGWALRGNRTVSGRIARRDGARFLWAADPDLGGLHHVDLERGETRSFADLGEATRVVQVGDTVVTTLRHEGQIAMFRVDAGELVHGPRWHVGTEPFDVVATPEGTLFVSLSIDHAIVELDPLTMTELRRWETPAEPRWMVHWGHEVVVAHATGPDLLRIDTQTGDAMLATLPDATRPAGVPCADRPLVPRVTGELTVSPELKLLVPTLYVDPDLTCAPADTPSTPDVPEVGGYFSDSDIAEPGLPGRFNAAMVTLDLDHPAGRMVSWMVSANLATFDISPPLQVVRSYPTSIAVEADPITGQVSAYYVALEGSDALVYVDAIAPSPLTERTGSFWAASRNAMPLHGPVSDLRTDPTDGHTLLGWSWKDMRLSTFDRGEIALVHDTTQDFAGIGLPFPVIEFSGPETTLDLPAAPIPADVARGRDLFFTATDTALSASGAGVSCASCHADGRTDGLTWQFEDFPRQTPSLAGPVSETAPFTWTNAVPTLADEASATAQQRMGGHGLAPEQAADLAAYMDWTRDVASPEPRDDTEADRIAAGAAIFARPDVGCATCHTGPRLTDGQTHALYDLPAVATPSLVGLAGSAPYLHDGRFADLRALVDGLADGSMGSTATLTDDERDALAAYLRTL